MIMETLKVIIWNVEMCFLLRSDIDTPHGLILSLVMAGSELHLIIVLCPKTSTTAPNTKLCKELFFFSLFALVSD